MNFIVCAHNCVHQREGYCSLPNLSMAGNSANSDCIHFVEKKSKVSSLQETANFRDIFNGK